MLSNLVQFVSFKKLLELKINKLLVLNLSSVVATHDVMLKINK